jgi:hypothetical protein
MKKIILALMLGLIIGSVSIVAAQSETIEATISKFNIIVNGEYKQLQSDPLVYQGTTYIPLREIGNLLGYDVTYKADTRTIELNQSEPNIPEEIETVQTEPQPKDEQKEVGEGPMEEKLPSLESVNEEINVVKMRIQLVDYLIKNANSTQQQFIDTWNEEKAELENQLEELEQLKQQLESQQ